MSAHAAPAPVDGPALTIRGRAYPVVLPKLRDPRLHLAATITSLQVIGQVGFHFQLSIAQILVSLGTCAVLEVGIAARRQGVLLWPASALLTGNGVAFVLRVPHTAHGDWWSTRGWWIFAATAAVSLLSKHVIAWRGNHLFNPSNIGLVICFLALGRNRAVPLDFWWGPMSTWLVLALVVIVSGGFAILRRLALLRVALGFWCAFAASIAVLAAAGHAMTARWHLGPITGFHFWAVLVTSPEVLVFLFFMITDPKTAPRGARPRLVYGVSLGLLATLLIAPTTTEFAAKVALLGSLAIVCVAMPLLRRVRPRVRLAYGVPVAAAAYVGLLFLVTSPAPPTFAAAAAQHDLPPITIAPSRGVQSQLDDATARLVAADLIAAVPAAAGRPLQAWLEPGTDQGPPLVAVHSGTTTYVLHQGVNGSWQVGGRAQAQAASPAGPVVAGYRLRDVAASVGLGFRQGSFRFGVSNDYRAMMGGGVCWLDYNGDGRVDLFAVNSYASADVAQWGAHGGLPRTQLYENVGGRFRNVSRRAHADLAVQGDGCAAGDLNGDGRPDLVVTTTSGVQILWNEGRGAFRPAALAQAGWYAGAAIADVNGDGRPDLFVAGYSDPSEPVPGSLAGFPTNIAAVRDLLYLNEGGRRFRNVALQAGLEPNGARHGLGAQFVDFNGDGRPDLYVANDEDPNQLYENVAWPGGAEADPAGLGFRFEERGRAERVDDGYAGMGIATEVDPQGRLGLYVTNSRREPTAAFRQGVAAGPFRSARPQVDPALGSGFAGWGASFVDVRNDGRPALVVAAGGIPVKSLRGDAEPIRVLAPTGAGFASAGDALGGLRVNGRGIAAADVANDGRMDVAVNTIGGRLLLLQPAPPHGHWLDVELATFAPGAVVEATLPGGRRLVRVVQAGSSYLSSEDPRVHFGLGAATRVLSLTVRYPFGGVSRLRGIGADRILRVPAPPPRGATRTPSAACTSAAPSVSIARYWNRVALGALRLENASAPVQARDLLDLSLAMQKAAAQAHGSQTAISYAAYRLLVWRASFGSNLDRTFGLLTHALGALCESPAATTTRGRTAVAVGNRVGAQAIATGRRDGSLEAQHYTDESYVPVNAPLAVSQAVSTVHDPAFWQPLAYGRRVQSFVDAQWGSVRQFAPGPLPHVGRPAALVDSAVAVLRATAAGRPAAASSTPIVWNRVLDGAPRVPLARDLQRFVLLNGALNDAAVTAWREKRASQAPRPISVIRYLAFNDRLPLVRGVVERRGGTELVKVHGAWVPGASWTPLAPTPASPAGVSEQSAFAFAANEVLTALLGRSYERQAEQASAAAVANGIESPGDAAAGRALGVAIGKRVLAP